MIILRYNDKMIIMKSSLPGALRKGCFSVPFLPLNPATFILLCKRFAIDYRNRWMIDRSDYVVTYVVHDLGSGAAKYKRLAEEG